MIRWILMVFGVILVGGVSVTSAASPTAKLRVSPASGTVTVGGTLSVDVLLDTGGQSVSYVVGDIGFSDGLEFVSGSANNSVMSTTVQAPAANGQTVRFEVARTQDDGYNGSSGHVVRLAFRPKSEGKATVTINQSGSQVLAFEDSSNILSSVGNGAYTVSVASGSSTSSTSKTTAKATAQSSPAAEVSSTAVAPDELVTPSPESTVAISNSPSPLLAEDSSRSGGQSMAVLGQIGQTAINVLAMIGGLAIIALIAVSGWWLKQRTARTKAVKSQSGTVATASQSVTQAPTVVPPGNVPPSSPVQSLTDQNNQPPRGQL